MAGIIGAEVPAPLSEGESSGKRYFEYVSTNKTERGAELEYVGPHITAISDRSYGFLTPDSFEPMAWVSHGHPCVISTDKPIEPGYIVRMRTAE
jgi:putative protease